MLSGSGLAAVRLITGIARSKWIALKFGLEGVGLLAQATQFQLLAVSTASLSVTSALIQGSRGQFRHEAEQLFQTALALILLGSGCLVAITFLAGPAALGAWLFGPGHGAMDFLLVLASVPFVLVSSAFVEASYFIHDRFDRYSLASAVHSLAQPFVFIALTLAFGVKGILLAFPLMACLLALLFLADLSRLGLLQRAWFRPRWNGVMARFLAGHGAAMFLTGVGGGFLVLFVRSSLVTRLGLGENGILQVPIALSAYGGAVITNFIWGRIHPFCSAGLGAKEEGDVCFAALAAFLVAVGTWAAAPLMIPAVYSKAFLSAVPLIGIQSTGDIFYYCFFTLAVVLLASGRILLYVVAWAVFYSPYLLALSVPHFQSVRGIVSLHLAASALAFSFLVSVGIFARLAPKGLLGRLGLSAIAFGLLLGGASLADPIQLFIRWPLALLIIVGGVMVWRLIYGEVANMNELKSIARRLMRLSGMDRLLGAALRAGMIPKKFERLAPQYRDYGSPTVRRISRSGLVLDLDLSDLPDWKAYFRNRDKKREKMYSLVPTGAKVLEIGCARGWVALNLAQRIGPQGRLIAADAHRPSVEETARRISLNAFHWASAACIAFSDREGTIAIAPEADQNSASVSVALGTAGAATRAVKLDDWLREEKIPDPDILKISVNGWETQVVKGAMEYLGRKKPLLFTEVGDFNLRRGGSSPAELLGLLRGLGYRIETTWGDPSVPEGEKLNSCLFDVVCFPPSSRD